LAVLIEKFTSRKIRKGKRRKMEQAASHNNYYVMPLNSKYRIKKRISGKTEKKNSTEKRGYNEFKSAIYLHKKSA